MQSSLVRKSRAFIVAFGSIAGLEGLLEYSVTPGLAFILLNHLAFMWAIMFSTVDEAMIHFNRSSSPSSTLACVLLKRVFKAICRSLCRFKVVNWTHLSTTWMSKRFS